VYQVRRLPRRQRSAGGSSRIPSLSPREFEVASHVASGKTNREVAASFAPEYHDTKRDTALALRSSASFSLLVYIFLPMTIGLFGVTRVMPRLITRFGPTASTH